MTIDLNCDMGESPDVPEERLMPLISSANIACGSHAGDLFTMERTLRLARRHGVACGAHPGYPDPANFGRRALPMTPAEISESVYTQLQSLASVAEAAGVSLTHVKPHGALYNVAAKDSAVALAIAGGVARWRRSVILVGLAGSTMLEVWRSAGFRTAAEGFVDRAYEPDGSLRPRSLPGALITEPAEAAAQAIALARRGDIRTLCIHGDSPGAVGIAEAVRKALDSETIVVRPL